MLVIVRAEPTYDIIVHDFFFPGTLALEKHWEIYPDGLDPSIVLSNLPIWANLSRMGGIEGGCHYESERHRSMQRPARLALHKEVDFHIHFWQEGFCPSLASFAGSY